MKKFVYIILLFFMLFSISACSQDTQRPYEILDSSEENDINDSNYNPEFTQVYMDGFMYNDISEYDDSKVYFRVMHLYIPLYEDNEDQFEGHSWYAFQIITNKKYEVSFTCGDSYHVIETNVGGYNNISENVRLSYEEGSIITVSIRYQNEIIYTDSFVYISDDNQVNLANYQEYRIDEFSDFNYIYIVLISVTLFISSLFVYRSFYKRSVNKSLKRNQAVKSLDLSKFVLLVAIIIATLSILTGYVWKKTYEVRIFNNTHHVQTIVLMDGTTLEDLEIDYSTLSLYEVEVREVEGELIRYPQYNERHTIGIDYSLIEEDIISILEGNSQQGLCGGDPNIANYCIVYGPLPAIKITLSNDDVTVVLKIENNTSVLGGESVRIYLEIYSDDYVYLLNYCASGNAEETLEVWNNINYMFLQYYNNDMLD